MKKLILLCTMALLIFATPFVSVAQDDGNAPTKTFLQKADVSKVTFMVTAPVAADEVAFIAFTSMDYPACDAVKDECTTNASTTIASLLPEQRLQPILKSYSQVEHGWRNSQSIILRQSTGCYANSGRASIDVLRC